MKKNKFSKSKKCLIIGCCIALAILTALILTAALIESSVAADILSMIASILSIGLSFGAIIYTAYSNIQTDKQLKQILTIVKEVKQIEAFIGEFRSKAVSEQTPELQEKLKQYEKDLELVDQFLK